MELMINSWCSPRKTIALLRATVLVAGRTVQFLVIGESWEMQLKLATLCIIQGHEGGRRLCRVIARVKGNPLSTPSKEKTGGARPSSPISSCQALGPTADSL